LDMLCPGHFGNVDKSFNAFLKLDKGSIISNRYHSSLDSNIFRIFEINFIPWMRLQLLKPQRYALTFFIKVNNGHIEALIQRNNFARMVHPPPREIRNVQ